MSELPEFKKDPKRLAFISAVSRVLGEGIVLDGQDVNQGAIKYGYGPQMGRGIMEAYSTRLLMQDMNNVNLVATRYKRRPLFMDGNTNHAQGLIKAEEIIDSQAPEYWKRASLGKKTSD